MRRPHPADIAVVCLVLCALAFFIPTYLGDLSRPQVSLEDARIVPGGTLTVQEKLDLVLGMEKPASDAGKLDLNLADAAALAALPGIGEVLAARIVEYRRYNGDFAAVDELAAVAGISAQRSLALQEYLYVGAAE